jgi:hypothetical protein
MLPTDKVTGRHQGNWQPDFVAPSNLSQNCCLEIFLSGDASNQRLVFKGPLDVQDKVHLGGKSGHEGLEQQSDQSNDVHQDVQLVAEHLFVDVLVPDGAGLDIFVAEIADVEGSSKGLSQPQLLEFPQIVPELLGSLIKEGLVVAC